MNHEVQAEARRVNFNISALHRIAATAAGAQSVTAMEKIGESINRVFMFILNDGQQAIARLPTSLSFPPHYTTASEVATLELLRRMKFPVP